MKNIEEIKQTSGLIIKKEKSNGLGHSQLSTTQIYAEVRNEKIIDAQQKVVGGISTI